MDLSRDVLHFQEKFCLTADLFAQCFDTNGYPMTDISGDADDVALLKELIDESEIKS